MARGPFAYRSASASSGGSGGSDSGLAFATIADAADYDWSGETAAGNVCEILSVGCLWFYSPNSALTPDGITIVDVVGGGGGQILRQSETSAPRWQLQALWIIDPLNGDDEGTGSLIDPLLTFAEVRRRVGMVPKVAMTIRFHNEASTAENIFVDFLCTALTPMIIEATVAAQDSLGVISSNQDWDGATSTDGEITIVDLPVSWTASALIQTVLLYNEDTNCGFWAVKDLGSKAARITYPVDINDAESYTPNADGNTVSSTTLFALYGSVIYGTSTAYITFRRLDFGGELLILEGLPSFHFCRLGGGFSVLSSALPVCQGSMILDSYLSGGGRLFASASGLASTMTADGGCHYLLNDSVIQDCTADIQTGSQLHIDNANSFLASYGGNPAFDLGPGALMDVSRGYCFGTATFAFRLDAASQVTFNDPPNFTAETYAKITNLTKTKAQIPYVNAATEAGMVKYAADAPIDTLEQLTTDQTTTSATFATLLTVNVTAPCACDFDFDVQVRLQHVNSSVALFRIQVDGVTVTRGRGGTSGNGQAVSCGISARETVAAGARAVTLQWAVASGGQSLNIGAAANPELYGASLRVRRSLL